MLGVLAALAGVIGLALGSFANVVIYRVPAGLSIVSPPSACMNCGHGVRPKHNVPVFGWLVLRGRCADCKSRISVRYPLVELGIGLAFVGVILGWGLTWQSLMLLVFVWMATVLALIDVDTFKLPRVLVWPWFALAGAVAIASALSAGDHWIASRFAIGAASVGAIYGLTWFVYPRGLGFGDVRLSLVLGGTLGFFGWPELVVGTFSAFLWGAIGSIAPMLAAKKVAGVRIPFGPWMMVGAVTGILAGDAVSGWYLRIALGL